MILVTIKASVAVFMLLIIFGPDSLFPGERKASLPAGQKASIEAPVPEKSAGTEAAPGSKDAKPAQGADGKGKEKDSMSDPASVSAAIYTANLTAIVAVLTAGITAILSIWTTGKSLRVSSRNDIIAAFANDAAFRNAIGDIVGATNCQAVVDGINNAGVQVLLGLNKDGDALEKQMKGAAESLKTGQNSQAADKLREYFRELLSA